MLLKKLERVELLAGFIYCEILPLSIQDRVYFSKNSESNIFFNTLLVKIIIFF